MPTPEEYQRITKGPQSPQEKIWWNKYSHANLEPWRRLCDPAADACTALIQRSSPARMLDEVEQRAKTEGGVFQDYIDQCYNVPGWVDFPELEKGRHLFRRYAAFQGVILMCSSLVEGYTLYNPAQVLISTGRLQKDVSKRIFETGQMLHNIVGEQGLRPGGLGHKTCMEVRLLHSAVRQHLWGSGKWDAAKLGEPINQEDMAATVLGFDFMFIRGLKKLGIKLTKAEHSAMHYYWRYVGYLLGVDEALLTESPEEQEILGLQVTTHLYRPTEGGEQLVKALLRGMSDKPPFQFSEDFLLAMAAYLGGPILERDFHINYSLKAKLGVRAFVQAARIFRVGEHLTPEVIISLAEKGFHKFRRQSIVNGLGGPQARFAFSGID